MGNPSTPSTNSFRELVLPRSKINLHALKRNVGLPIIVKLHYPILAIDFFGLLHASSATSALYFPLQFFVEHTSAFDLTSAFSPLFT